MATKKLRPLTAKQKKFVEGIVQNKTQTQAYKDAYNVAPTTKLETIYPEASKTTRLPQVQNALRPFLEKHNITMDTAIAPIGKGLKAVKQNEYTGEITEDIATQLKASDRALKLLGVTNNDLGGTINFHLHQSEQRQKYDL